MFKVKASTLKDYFNWDPERKESLLFIDRILYQQAPELKRWFYHKSANTTAGMRTRLIGYGWFLYEVSSGAKIKWPIIGLALQKHYVSVYLSVLKDDKPILDDYVHKLGALRYGCNHFSLADPDKLNLSMLSSLIKAVSEEVKKGAHKSLQYSKSKKSKN